MATLGTAAPALADTAGLFTAQHVSSWCNTGATTAALPPPPNKAAPGSCVAPAAGGLLCRTASFTSQTAPGTPEGMEQMQLLRDGRRTSCSSRTSSQDTPYLRPAQQGGSRASSRAGRPGTPHNAYHHPAARGPTPQHQGGPPWVPQQRPGQHKQQGDAGMFGQTWQQQELMHEQQHSPGPYHHHHHQQQQQQQQQMQHHVHQVVQQPGWQYQGQQVHHGMQQHQQHQHQHQQPQPQPLTFLSAVFPEPPAQQYQPPAALLARTAAPPAIEYQLFQQHHVQQQGQLYVAQQQQQQQQQQVYLVQQQYLPQPHQQHQGFVHPQHQQQLQMQLQPPQPHYQPQQQVVGYYAGGVVMQSGAVLLPLGQPLVHAAPAGLVGAAAPAAPQLAGWGPAPAPPSPPYQSPRPAAPGVPASGVGRVWLAQQQQGGAAAVAPVAWAPGPGAGPATTAAMAAGWGGAEPGTGLNMSSSPIDQGTVPPPPTPPAAEAAVAAAAAMVDWVVASPPTSAVQAAGPVIPSGVAQPDRSSSSSSSSSSSNLLESPYQATTREELWASSTHRFKQWMPTAGPAAPYLWSAAGAAAAGGDEGALYAVGQGVGSGLAAGRLSTSMAAAGLWVVRPQQHQQQRQQQEEEEVVEEEALLCHQQQAGAAGHVVQVGRMTW